MDFCFDSAYETITLSRYSLCLNSENLVKLYDNVTSKIFFKNTISFFYRNFKSHNLNKDCITINIDSSIYINFSFATSTHFNRIYI